MKMDTEYRDRAFVHETWLRHVELCRLYAPKPTEDALGPNEINSEWFYDSLRGEWTEEQWAAHRRLFDELYSRCHAFGMVHNEIDYSEIYCEVMVMNIPKDWAPSEETLNYLEEEYRKEMKELEDDMEDLIELREQGTEHYATLENWREQRAKCIYQDHSPFLHEIWGQL